ncbi:MAG: type 2 lanthipeptide synthetase LanM [Eubacteriales bacterium]|nr:type 2 lanthipeptide synthetase LanM [Eubacteriales bacterium]
MFSEFGKFIRFKDLEYEENPRIKRVLSRYAVQSIEKQISSSLIKSLMRIFILDIHELKDAGKLQGETPETQYTYYHEVWLNDQAHIESLYARFPEMYRLINLKAHYFINMLEEIVINLETDRELIKETFCNNQKFERIVDLDLAVGDSHNGGRCAAKVTLDNGTVLYYKPHSLRKNEVYQEAYEFLCKKAGITCRKVKYLSRADHGWEENIENKGCHTRDEVRRYYFRMGIHLFMGYVLSATDLHGENIIAHGEHPVIIDMETFPGYYIEPEDSDGDRKIETIIAGSVIHTGMLPVLNWGKGNSTVILSAMNSSAKITTPFRMPVVKKDKTSDVYIDYEPVQFEIKECIVRLNGVKVNAGEYVEPIVQGFKSAYFAALSDIYMEKILSRFWRERSRVVLRHTQQYVMYQMASLHPDYMEDKSQREQLLSVIHKSGESQLQKEIHDYEISSLVQMDIPYFELQGDSLALYDGNGRKYENYFPASPYVMLKKHLSQMNEEDMNRQCDFIRLSMALLSPGSSRSNNKKTLSLAPPLHLKSRMRSQIEKIMSWICDTAVIAGEDINWIGLQFYEKDRWNMGPSGMYLYGGISGIALFLAYYLHNFSNERVEKIFRLVSAKLVRYTEELCERKNPANNLRTGLYDGESSLVYSYLLLYDITGNIFYLNYAEKHFHAMKSYLAEDKCYDLLAGNAGAIVAAIKLFYAVGDKKYLESAVGIEQQLWEHRQEMERGVGWELENTAGPLAGMAHGNSGFLMAYSMLYEAVGDTSYLNKIDYLLKYEDSLYSEESGNWRDLRSPGNEGHIINAWCHGAPGILVSRLKLSCVSEFEMVHRDIQRAAQALFVREQNGQICLCHGTAGRLLIMRQYLKEYQNMEYRKLYNETLNSFVYDLEDWEKLNADEYLNPAFMNGITGVGLALIELYKNNETPL